MSSLARPQPVTKRVLYSLLAGFYAQSRGQMGFAGAAFAHKNDVAAFFHIITIGKLLHQSSIQLRRCFKIEGLQRL